MNAKFHPREWNGFVWYVVTVIGCLLLFIAFESELNHFLMDKFPDPGTDDLSLPYVFENLPSYYRAILLAMLASAVWGVKEKSLSLIAIAALLFNFQFYVLMRSNYEFCMWMISGPHPHYGGMGLGLLMVAVLGCALMWVMIKVIHTLSEVSVKERFQSAIKLGKFFGLGITAMVTLFHFVPVLIFLWRLS